MLAICSLDDLVLAIAASQTTIDDYLDLCEQLWCCPKHNPWIVAALMRKASVAKEKPDYACVEFLSDKAHKALDLASIENAPTQKEFGQFLPTIIQLMPSDTWAKPTVLWQRLITAIAQEFGLVVPKMPEEGTATTDNKSAELASLFAKAVGSPWTKNLNKQLESWREDPDYVWLIALREAKKLDTMIAVTRQQLTDAYFLDNYSLLEHLYKMSPFERRRFLLLHDVGTDEKIMTDPIIDPAASTIMWRFNIAVPNKADILVVANEQAIGNILLIRTPEGNIAVESTTDICTALAPDPKTILVPIRAAADEAKKYIHLTKLVKGALQAVHDGVILELHWQAKEPKS